MDRSKAESIVMDPYVPATHPTVGFYLPTETFKAHAEHVCVMDNDTGGLLAITGPVVPDDEEHNFACLCEAVVYSGAFEMLDLVKQAAKGLPVEYRAKEILESLRHKMDDLQPKGCSPEGLKNSIMHKLGLIHAAIAKP